MSGQGGGPATGRRAMIVNFNGRFLEEGEPLLPADDGAVLFGDTLFETMKARGRVLLRPEDHLDRMELSARLLDFPFDRKSTARALAETAERLEAPLSRLRLTLGRGSFSGLSFPSPERSWFLLTAAPYTEPEEERRAGVACVLAPNRRVNPLSHLPQMKRGNYADCLYAAHYAQSRGAREALFVTPEGRVLEGAASNLFLVIGQTLVTPPAGELVLPGIMRRRVLEAATFAELVAEEREVGLAELHKADEVFLTNSLIEILPVASLEGRPLRRGTVAERLLEEVRAEEGKTRGFP